MILKIKHNQRGYSALELIGVLATFCFIILMANKIITVQLKTREINQLADQSKSYSHIAIKYLEDNYRKLVQQTDDYTEVIIPFSIFSGYAPNEITTITKRYQTPCLYTTKGNNNTLIAYLIFGNNNSRAKSLEQLTVAKIAQTLGDNAGTLISQNGSYTLNGGVENNFNFSSSSINSIISSCGFRAPLPKYSLVIDLTKNINLFASTKSNLDQQSTAKEPDPSLKKEGNSSQKNVLATMETNLYLDNIVKESTLKTTYYCDATKLPINDANTVCMSYANSYKISMYSGTAKWISSLLDASGKNCIATANAHFYKTSTVYTCTGVSFGDANTYCKQKVGNIAPGSGYWSPNPGVLNNNQCSSIPYAQYKCQTWKYWYNICHNEVSITCTNGTTYAITGSCPPAGTKMPCNGQVWWVNDPPPTCVEWKPAQACSTDAVSIPAKQTQSTNDMGYKNC